MADNFLTVFVDNFFDNLAWFVISTIVLVVLLPVYIDWREYRKRKTVRRMIASRISRVIQMLEAYLDTATNNQGRRGRENQLLDLKNAIHHMMAIPAHFSSALTGKIGATYFAYRVTSTNVAATASLALGDYDEFFSDIFFTHAEIPTSSIKELNDNYISALKTLGGDIYNVQAMQPVVPAWSRDQTERLEKMYCELHKNKIQVTPDGTVEAIERTETENDQEKQRQLECEQTAAEK